MQWPLSAPNDGLIDVAIQYLVSQTTAPLLISPDSRLTVTLLILWCVQTSRTNLVKAMGGAKNGGSFFMKSVSSDSWSLLAMSYGPYHWLLINSKSTSKLRRIVSKSTALEISR
jgi:hypothetical protein